MCAILGAKLSETEKERNKWRNRALDFQLESDSYWDKYIIERFENIALKHRVGCLERELLNYAKKNDEE